MNKRAAVVIGVDRTGELTELEGCATGAEAVARWLRAEGFDTIELTDANNKIVTAAMVTQAVSTFVSAQTYNQLVLFFSGHGYWKNETELWLLSNAPKDANEAISWMETAEFAKDCGIPNVVLISDACRTIPQTKSAMRVRGSIVFPNENFSPSRSKVDKFMAAAIGQPAYETKLDPEGTRSSVFTHCLLQAFREPDAESVDEVIDNGASAFVVTNRKLGPMLQRRVPEVLAAINPTYAQEVDAEVLSENDAYIAKAKRPPVGAFPELGPAQQPSATLREVAAIAVSTELGSEIKISKRRLTRVKQFARQSGFDQKIDDAVVVTDVQQFETQTGFTVMGDTVIDVAATLGAKVAILARGSADEPAIIRVDLDGRASSVGIRFGNGQATVLAALFGYIAHVTVKNDAVVSVNYVPSENSFRWNSYADRRKEIEKLRAVSTAAARSGVFRLSDENEAVAFAERARIEKGIDPSLGLYASYAYSQADLRESIASVLHYMQSDLEVLVYDVALLAKHPALTGDTGQTVVPFCPMLTQGWNLLRSRGVMLQGILDRAQDDLEPSLWTTFKEGSAVEIIEAIRKGELQ
ncbi:caspase family protein [Rhizobium leguminosarum]|uniref:caspase family protein n=1 Tax=Rhizobium leguminosarum TaxID=384 RepID=UPI001C953B3B|nr:caspase family protein [Rhizobium leguminosarum]MBY5666859.1 caspase family protein [Rhizobium leguminosarum]MBY5680480.1 caspase family protein [Rhizobium leguminosarum]